jgi:hypothetical protein
VIDRTTKALLALIAVGLFLNVFVPLVQPPVVNAQNTMMIETYLGGIYSGVCINTKIC